jgi:signal transduction histidine kinase
MLKGILARGVFYWLRAPRDYAIFHGEQWVVALARLFLSFWFFLAVGRSSGDYLGRQGILLLLYALYSLSIILALRLRSQSSPFFHIGIHGADVLWAVYLSLLIDWPGMSFVLFFLILISSKLRWGFWEAQLTTLSFILISLAGALAFQTHLPTYHRAVFDQVLETLLYCLLSLVIGFLAEVKVAHLERSSTAAMVESIRVDDGMQKALQDVCNTGIQLFRATQLLVAIHEGDRASLFRATNSAQGIQSSELSSGKWDQYFFPAPARSWRVSSIRGNGMPESFLAEHPLRLLLGVALTFDDGISARVYVIDPMPWFGGAAGLGFLERSVCQIAPIIHSLYQVERARKKADAAAGGRMARELHDGTIQSLACINLQLEELWRRAGPALAHEADLLAKIQKNIREEIASLREFTTQLRSLELDSGRLLGHLSQMAVKFQCEHGIAAKFVSDVEEVRLRPNVCVEVARIAQEALVNVRKHSAAGEVLIRFSRRNGDYVLGVVDNGRGFGFSGRRSHEELQASGEGPAVIMDRAREICGKVSIESVQGRGAYLEVTIPL